MTDFISRSLTTRRAKKPEKVNTAPSRSFSMKKSSNTINRIQISGPVNLISTTNMLSYNAPDIAGTRQVSAESHSTSHSEESDRSSTSSGSRGVSTDASSVDSLPTSPETNPSTGFFDSRSSKERSHTPRSASSSTWNSKPPSARPSMEQVARPLESKRSMDNLQSKRSQDLGQAKRTLESKRSMDSIRAAQEAGRRAQESIPDVPQRARSHSKEAHEVMARKRSIRNMGPPSSLHSRGSSLQEQRSSVDMFNINSGGSVEPPHPFGRELEQLNEVVEELGGVIRDVEMDEDSKFMLRKGLQKFCAADYLAEIAPYKAAAYERRPAVPPPTLSTTWI